ncbi:MAG: leucine-rich repeat protein [Muribaculaceae bacterium]|nr:leucine-rich repeat protein [Muribaculaceae bacterium]
MKNKTLLFKLVALVAATMCALGASAYDFESNGIYYNITGSNTVEVTKKSTYGMDYSGAVTVPSTVTNGGKTYTVTRVGKSAFLSCDALMSVDLPTTIEVIDTTAFYYTTALKSINIPEGVKRIEPWNFYVIDSLTTVVLPSTLQFIGSQCFQSCTKLSSVTCLATTPPPCDYYNFTRISSDGVLHVPMSSVNAYSVAEGWKNFSNIQGIQEDPGAQYDFVMDGIYYNYGYDENTGDYGPGSSWVSVVAKDDNYNSYSGVVIIPEMVTYGGKTYEVGEIADGCFKNCTGLTAVSIPMYVTWIGSNAFYGCTALTKVYCDAAEPPYLETNAFTSSQYSSVTLTVPKGSKSAYQSAYSWKRFTNIQEAEYDFVVDGIYYNNTGSNTVEVTYRNTLYGTYYGEVTVPSTVTYNGTTYNVTRIGNLAFYKSANLTKLTLPTSLTSLGEGAFALCENLPSLKIPHQVTTIPNSCCLGCYRMTEVTIPHSATSIEPYAFYQCYQLDKVVVPNNVTTIGERAFDVCMGLKKLTLGTGVTSIGDYAFSASDLEHLICRAAVPPTIGFYSFQASDVQELIVPRGSINAYRNADNWKRISTVKAIGDYLAEALNPVGDFTFDSSGDYIWKVETYADGSYYCLGSGNRFVHNTTSVLTATVTVDNTSTLSFYFEAKGEGTGSYLYDKCVFKIDGVQQFCYGQHDASWEKFITDLPPGTHTLEWSYTKDNIVSTAYDYFHMWDLRLSPSLNGALNVAGGNIQFQSTGDYPWQVVQEGSRTYAMSGNAGVSNSTSELMATVNVDKASTLSFDFKAWGEGTSTIYDRCSFYINNVEVFYKGAYQNDWETYSTDLEPGTYTLKWSYTKDNSVDKPGDYFAVDNVAITSAGGLRGDVNGDGNVTIADVTALIDILLSGTTAPAAADCNQDNSVSIADVTALIDYLLSGSW